MSKAKDRARAKSGIIFRDGKYVNKEEWYAAHPSRTQLLERQVGVDKAVAELMKAKRLIEEAGSRGIVITDEREAAGESELAAPQGKTYFCTKCLKYHRKPESKIYRVHMEFEDHNVPTIKEGA